MLRTGTVRRAIEPFFRGSSPLSPCSAMGLTLAAGGPRVVFASLSSQGCHVVVPDKGARDSASGRPLFGRPVCRCCFVAAGAGSCGRRRRNNACQPPSGQRSSSWSSSRRQPSPRRIRASRRWRMRSSRLLLRAARVLCRHSSARGAIDNAVIAGETLRPAVTDIALGLQPSRLDRPPRPRS